MERYLGVPTGVHVLLLRAGRVLLMRRAGTGFFDGLFSLPGGHVEPGERLGDTAVREMGEELNIGLRTEDLRVVGVVHRRSDTNRIDFFMATERWSGEPEIAEPDKCDGLRWCAPTDLPEDTVAYAREALERVAGQVAEPWVFEYGWPEQE